jgi:hypothetical protein
MWGQRGRRFLLSEVKEWMAAREQQRQPAPGEPAIEVIERWFEHAKASFKLLDELIADAKDGDCDCVACRRLRTYVDTSGGLGA